MTLTKQKCVLKHFFGRVALNIAQEDFYQGDDAFILITVSLTCFCTVPFPIVYGAMLVEKNDRTVNSMNP